MKSHSGEGRHEKLKKRQTIVKFLRRCLEVAVAGRHVPGTPLAVALVGGAGDAQPPPPPVVEDTARAWATRAVAALAELGEDADYADPPPSPPRDPAGRPLDPATAAHAAAHPGVPIVEDLADLWLVGRLQRERERKAKAAAGLAPEQVELARREMAAMVAAERGGAEGTE